VDPPVDTDVTIPEGTQVTTPDGLYVFETTEALVIAYDEDVLTGSVLARRTVTGHTLLKPGVLTSPIDTVAYVTQVTNLTAVDSGLELEPLEQTLERVKRYQRRGERIVSTKDLEEAIAEEALEGNGVVRAFPFVRNGDFGPNVEKLVGHTTVVVMTKTGDNIDATAMQRIASLLDTAVGNQFIYVVNPSFVEFNVEVNVMLTANALSDATVAAIEANLRNFYSPSREQFGRPILRSEIIAVIEGTAGVDRIVVPEVGSGGGILNTIDGGPGVGLVVVPADGLIIASPQYDSKLAEYELPKLEDVTITVV
jgi:hypothetical protein